MTQLQISLFGPYFTSLSSHSYHYETSSELNPGLKHQDFRYGHQTRQTPKGEKP